MATRGTGRHRAMGVVAVLALVVGLTACGGSDDGDTTPVTEAPTTVAVTDPPTTTAPPTTEVPDTAAPTTEAPPTTEADPAHADEPELVWQVVVEGRPASLAIDAGGDWFVVGVGAAYVMQLADGELLDVVVHPSAPRSVGVSPDGGMVVAGLSVHGAGVSGPAGEPVPGLDGLRTMPGSPVGLVGAPGEFDTFVSFSPGGDEFVTGNRAGVVERWSSADGASLGVLTGAGDAVVAVEHDPTGALVAITRAGCEVEVVEVATGAVRQALELASGDGSCGLASTLVTFTPDGASLLVATRDDESNAPVLQVFETEDASPVEAFEVLDRVRAIDVSPDGDLVVVAARLGTTIHQLPGGSVRAAFDETFDATATQQPLAARFTPDGGHIVLTRGDGSIELWRLPGADELVAPEREPCDPVPIPGDVLFDTASATLRPDADDVLGSLASELADGFPVATLTFVGHTDSRGADAANQQLSEERAAAVQRWFETWAAATGVDGWSTAVVGRGASELRVADTDADGGFLAEAGALNRRVEILIDAEGCAN